MKRPVASKKLAVPEVEAVVETKSIVPGDRRGAISAFGARALDNNPVLVYLARFATEGGRKTQLGALKAVARIFNMEDPIKLPWSEIGYQHVVALRTKLSEKKLAPATINRILSAVRGVCQEAVRLGILNDHDGQLIAGLRGVKGSSIGSGRHLDAEKDLCGIFQGAADLVNPVCACRDRALLSVLRLTGIRRAEVVELNLDDIDWGIKKIKKNHDVYLLNGTWKGLARTKGNKKRTIYLAGCAQELKAWLHLRGMEPGPLFYAVHKSGSIQMHRMNPCSVNFIVERAADGGHVANVSPHDFRRTAVGELLDLGVDLRTVQRFIGHSNVNTTAVYDRRPERVAEEASHLLSIPEFDDEGEEEQEDEEVTEDGEHGEDEAVDDED